MATRPTRRDTFQHLVSPLGRDAAETPVYSPSTTLPERKQPAPPAKQAIDTEYRRNDRRDGR